MLRVVPSASPAQAKKYYSESLDREREIGEYYFNEQELPGRWHGKGADRLGLGDELDKQSFFDLIDNKHPGTSPEAGATLTQRQRQDRTPGYDFNFHAPKSVSLFYGMTGEHRILELFQQSVRETMKLIETDMQTRVRRNGADHDRLTGEMIWAEFTHLTSRPIDQEPPDPHLHTHAYVVNATFDAMEDQWKAGQFRDLKRHAPYYEAVFHSKLAAGLNALGLTTERRGKKYELAAIPEDLIRRFSKRTVFIEQYAKEHGVSNAKAMDKLGAMTRNAKSRDWSMSGLRLAWEDQMDTTEGRAVHNVHKSSRNHARKSVSAGVAVDHGLSHHLYYRSTVGARQLATESLWRGMGSLSVDQVEQEIGRRGLIERRIGADVVLTTAEVLAEEQAMIKFVGHSRGSQQPFRRTGPINYLDSRLTDQQRAVVEGVLRSMDQVLAIRGAAGTGKTAMLQELAGQVARAGYKEQKRIYAFAPTTTASRGQLRSLGFADANTVATLIKHKEDWLEKIRGQVIVIDEAGMVGSQDMHSLMQIAEAVDARVILVGDPQQHSSVPRGDPLRVLQDHAALQTFRLERVMRQRDNPELLDVAQLLADGRILAGHDRLEEMGAIETHKDEGDRYQALAEAYVRAKQYGDVLVVAPTHAEKELATNAIRDELWRNRALGDETGSVSILKSPGWSASERKDAAMYQIGMVIEINQNLSFMWDGGFKKGDRLYVQGHNRLGQLIVVDQHGRSRAAPLGASEKFEVYERAELELRVGDEIRFTRGGVLPGQRSYRDYRVSNGLRGKIKGFTDGGDVVLDNDRVMSRLFGHIDLSYVNTSYQAQGQTAPVLLAALSGQSMGAIDMMQFYTTMTRGARAARIFTDDPEQLRQMVQRDTSQMSAVELADHPDAIDRRQQRQDYARERRVREARKRTMKSMWDRARGRQPQRERGFDR